MPRAEPYWNEECTELTGLVWNPDPGRIYCLPYKAEEFNCSHPDIKMYYRKNLFRDVNSKIDPKIEFLEVKKPDNTKKKEKKRKTNLKTEDTRFRKEIQRTLDTFEKNSKESSGSKRSGSKSSKSKASSKNKRAASKKSGSKSRSDDSENEKKPETAEEFLERHKKIIPKEVRKTLITKHEAFLEKKEKDISLIDAYKRSFRVQVATKIHQREGLLDWMVKCDAVHNDLVAKFCVLQKTIADAIEEGPNKRFEIAKALRQNEVIPIAGDKLRNLYIEEMKEKAPNVPFCVIANVIREFARSLKGNITKMEKGRIDTFEMKPKTERKKTHIISIDKKYISKKGPYPDLLGRLKISTKGVKWSDTEGEIKIIYVKHMKKFYVHMYRHVFPTKIGVENPRPLIVLDPGERTFQTGFGMDHVIDIACEPKIWIDKIHKKIDNLNYKMGIGYKRMQYNEKLGKKTRKRKKKYRRAIAKLYDKRANLRNELHCKTSNYLCKNYERIVLTDFSAKKVSRRRNKKDPRNDRFFLDTDYVEGEEERKEREIYKVTKRRLYALSFYKFRRRCLHRCEEYGRQLHVVEEAYTSKTCGMCGTINPDLGAAEVYECKNPICGNVQERDINGARNILIKHAAKYLRINN